MVRISVIVPAFRCGALLKRRAVESILQTGAQELEIVIVEDGSNDGTLETAAKIAHDNPRTVCVHHHPNHANRGVSATRNLGIERSSGEYLCFLDADDFVYPHRFERAVSILQAEPEVDGVHELTSVLFDSDEACQYWLTDKPHLFGFQERISSTDLLATLLSGNSWHNCRAIHFGES